MKPPLRLLLSGLFGLFTAANACAQDTAPVFRGQTLDGRAFDLERHRGRVVLVMLWRTDCAVCLDKMRELRANAEGWKSAPFDLVLVNLDPTVIDAATYDRVRREVTAPAPHLYSVWQGHAGVPADWQAARRLPLTLVIDRQGRIVGRHEGRVPPEVWNQVADLLP